MNWKERSVVAAVTIACGYAALVGVLVTWKAVEDGITTRNARLKCR